MSTELLMRRLGLTSFETKIYVPALFSATIFPFGPTKGLPLAPPALGTLWWTRRRCAGSAGSRNISVMPLIIPAAKFGVAARWDWISDPATFSVGYPARTNG